MNLLSILLTLSLTLTFALAEIKLVNVLFRHGDRSPGNDILKCPNCCDQSTGCNQTIIDSQFYPIGFGGLTNEGKQRAYKLGKYLRATYGNFLGSNYLPNEVEAVSSEVPRTRMTLQMVLAGLYPPNGIQNWNNQLDWQPAITSFKPRPMDTIFSPQMCEVYTNEFKRILASLELEQELAAEKMDVFLNRLRLDTGKSKKVNPIEANHLYHTLASMEAIKMPLPTWSKGMYPDGELRQGAIAGYRVYGYNDLMKKLAGGVVLKKMIDDMKAVEKQPKKIFLYSGHELNVAMLLQTLGLYNNQIPQYTSSVILELHEIQGKYSVKVLYYHGIPSKVDVLCLPGCPNELCPLDTFTQLLQHVTPSDEESKCRRVDLSGNVLSQCY